MMFSANSKSSRPTDERGTSGEAHGRLGGGSPEQMLAAKGRTLDAVVELTVDEQILLDRIQTRAAETGGARADDNAETLRTRLAVYHEQTAPIVPYYEAKGLLKRVDGMAPIEEVTGQLESVLGVGS